MYPFALKLVVLHSVVPKIFSLGFQFICTFARVCLEANLLGVVLEKKTYFRELNNRCCIYICNDFLLSLYKYYATAI